jgi:hypothetical protein
MPSIKDILTSYSALTELSKCANVILPTMKDPNVPREEKRKMLNVLVNELSEKTFMNGMIADQIITIINMKEEVCKEYSDTESQVFGIIEWTPRMAYHKDRLIKAVRKNRIDYGLKA